MIKKKVKHITNERANRRGEETYNKHVRKTLRYTATESFPKSITSLYALQPCRRRLSLQACFYVIRALCFSVLFQKRAAFPFKRIVTELYRVSVIIVDIFFRHKHAERRLHKLSVGIYIVDFRAVFPNVTSLEFIVDLFRGEYIWFTIAAQQNDR